ncbi:hypothetical protein QZH41_005564 [Actinostola sp. cb2023]|nr:hypothetical protein QZH41_005564 [Actinostola sp. cb2023]
MTVPLACRVMTMPLACRVRAVSVSIMWIGLSDRALEGLYIWEGDNIVAKNYTHWYSGEPNDHAGNEDCIGMYAGILAGYWNDDYCDNEKGYICEKPNGSANADDVRNIMLGETVSGRFLRIYPIDWSNNICLRTEIYGCEGRYFITKRTLVVLAEASQVNIVVTKDWISTTDFYWPLDALLGDQVLGTSSAQIKGNITVSSLLQNNKNVLRFAGYNAFIPVGDFPHQCISDAEACTVATPGCPTGWQRSPDGNVCYGLMLDKKNWFDARASCKKYGAELVSIHSGYRKWVVWIGLNDLGTEGVYTWSDASPLSYTNFANNEPNDWRGMEDCMEMRRYDGKWNDQNCGLQQPFVCRKHNNSVIPPYTMVPPTPGPAVGKCNPTWVNYDKSCYKFVFMELQNWANAQSVCQAGANGNMNGSLVSINNMYEQAFISTVINGYHGNLWIGLNDIHTEGTYAWIDNNPVTFVNWEKGKPSYSYYSDCVDMMTTKASLGRWDVQACTNFHGYICEAAALPLGPTPGLVLSFCDKKSFAI